MSHTSATLAKVNVAIKPYTIRPLAQSDRTCAATLVREHFGSERVVSRGVVLHDSRTLPGLIALSGNTRVGLLQHLTNADHCEVVILISVRRRAGIGTALLRTLQMEAVKLGLRRIGLVTTNNNTAAQDFYQSAGFRRVAMHEGAVTEARKIKPEIPEFDGAGTPILDEIEFEWTSV